MIPSPFHATEMSWQGKPPQMRSTGVEAVSADGAGTVAGRVDFSHVLSDGSVTPVFVEDSSRILVFLHLPKDFHPGALKTQIQAADPAEERTNSKQLGVPLIRVRDAEVLAPGDKLPALGPETPRAPIRSPEGQRPGVGQHIADSMDVLSAPETDRAPPEDVSPCRSLVRIPAPENNRQEALRMVVRIAVIILMPNVVKEDR
jgi:hypothetical protein